MENTIHKLYETSLGRRFLKILTAPALSKIAGAFLDKRISVFLIPLFIKSNNIDLSEVKKDDWQSFNHFFTRHLDDGARPVCMDESSFISPCDADLTVYPIEDGRFIMVKGIEYSVADLLRSKKLAEEYKDGKCLVFRLSTNHYHRYIFPNDGEKSRDIEVPGVLHTVQPIATQATNVYAQNSRKYCAIKTRRFGSEIFMQVGAMLVGRITNVIPEKADVRRGEEAGYFEYGGSTIIMLVKKGRVVLKDELLEASEAGEEYPVKLGEVIGEASR